jgi:hypothetical protein
VAVAAQKRRAASAFTPCRAPLRPPRG